eukprot:TRINITY_DN4241_c1_g1_i1.p1 TRINITY_DN4241_c1_g1~~TRINITY_DN4241_c1_g1_i1.p1  ORF type:complete len:567 (+),score=201.68 TRINITY_DN4241_c1_g1_i1:39-1739(+)
MRPLLPGLLICCAASAGAASLTACVLPPTLLLHNNASCAGLAGHVLDKGADLAGLVGEREAFQLLVEVEGGAPLHGLGYELTGAPAGTLDVRQVGFVKLAPTTRYTPSGGGWTSDPLLPLVQRADAASGYTAATLSATPPGAPPAGPSDTRSPLVLWVRYVIPAAAEALSLRVYTGADGAAGGVATPVAVAPWAHLPVMPSRKAVQRTFPQIWAFTDAGVESVYQFPGPAAAAASLTAYHEMMSDALLPPDNLYKGAPYANFTRYEDLVARGGAYYLNVGALGGATATPYTPAEVAAKLDAVAPAVAKLLANASWDVKPYVYGFDEQGADAEANIRALFGAVKKRWGGRVKTMAALNPWVKWGGRFPVDLPVDVLVYQYQGAPSEVPASFVAEWTALGKKIFFYHCIEPSGAAFLNTFIERPRTQGRQLYWHGYTYNASGWLYYATDLWKPGPGATRPIHRGAGGSALTDFDPANYIWWPGLKFWANGDGQFLYPGPGGAPVAAARLDLQRDAVEDSVLFAFATARGKRDAAVALIQRSVQGPTQHSDDPALLEATRRAVAEALRE